jgi:hypothetical protein
VNIHPYCLGKHIAHCLKECSDIALVLAQLRRAFTISCQSDLRDLPSLKHTLLLLQEQKQQEQQQQQQQQHLTVEAIRQLLQAYDARHTTQELLQIMQKHNCKGNGSHAQFSIARKQTKNKAQQQQQQQQHHIHSDAFDSLHVYITQLQTSQERQVSLLQRVHSTIQAALNVCITTYIYTSLFDALVHSYTHKNRHLCMST